MLAEPRAIEERHGLDPQQLDPAVLRSTTPLVLRGLVRDWPLAQAGATSAQAAAAYLRGFDRGEAVVAQVGPPDIGGRFFYNADMSGFNFRPERVPLGVVLETLLRDLHNPQPPAIYVGSTTLDTYLPGLRAHNPIALPQREPLASIWIGNRTRIAAHQTCPTTWPAWSPGAAALPCFRRSNWPICISARSISPRPVSRSAWWISPRRTCSAFHAMRRRWNTRWWPSWNRAMRCSFRACGGITSKR